MSNSTCTQLRSETVECNSFARIIEAAQGEVWDVRLLVGRLDIASHSKRSAATASSFDTVET